MIVRIDKLADLAQVPAEQRSMAEAAFDLWRANREAHASLRESDAAAFLGSFMDRDAIPDEFFWDCTTGKMTCP